jgi:hypothetical protein
MTQLKLENEREWPYVLHVIVYLFGACVDLDMEDAHLWALIASLDRPPSIVVFSCFAWFTGYYALSVADTLLKLDFLDSERTDFPELKAMQDWLPVHDFNPAHLFQLRWPNRFLGESHRAPFIQLDNRCFPEEMECPLLTRKTDRDRVLRNVRAMLNAFDWTAIHPASSEGSEVIEYKAHMVVSYDATFLLAEFLPLLRRAIRKGHQRTRLNALPLLGELICRPSSVALIGNGALTAWYDRLVEFAKSEHENERALAIGFAARTAFLGFRGSFQLLPVLAAAAKGVSSDALRSDAELVAAVLAMNVIANIADLDVSAGFVEWLREIRPPLRVPAFVQTIVEEALAGRRKIAPQSSIRSWVK